MMRIYQAGGAPGGMPGAGDMPDLSGMGGEGGGPTPTEGAGASNVDDLD